jgi:putative DNA primase/helicase
MKAVPITMEGGPDDLHRLDPDAPEPLRPITAGAFVCLDIPERRMQLRPILPEQSISMLYGPRGCGKTHVALGIAIAVASGTSFLRWTAPEPRRVLYVDGEMPASAIKERLVGAVQMCPRADLAQANLSILAADLRLNSIPDLSTPAGRLAFEPILDGFSLVILDNISTLCRTGKENEAESWGELQGWALKQRRAGRSVLFLHHAGKGGDQRGTSRREDVMDTIMRLARPEDYEAKQGARFIVEYTKARGISGDDVEPFEAMLHPDGWTVRDATSARDETIRMLKDEGLSQRDIAAEVGCGLATVNRVLKKRGGEG